jgi:hypothetical protein
MSSDLRHLVNALNASYCESYAKNIVARLDRGDLKFTEQQWKNLGESLLKARHALEHVDRRIIPFGGPETRSKKRRLAEWDAVHPAAWR